MLAQIADTGVSLTRDIVPGVNAPGTTRAAAEPLCCDSLIRDVDLGRVYLGTQPGQRGFCKQISQPPHRRDSCRILEALLVEWVGECRCSRCHRVNHHLTEFCDAPEDYGLGDAFYQ